MMKELNPVSDMSLLFVRPDVVHVSDDVVCFIQADVV